MKQINGPFHLMVNLLKEPYSVTKIPKFSWWDRNTNSDSYQKNFEIVVTKRFHKMINSNYLYDSYWVESSNNTSVALPGLRNFLEPGELYYWRVRIKDNHGDISDFSQPEKFICTDEIDSSKLKGIWSSQYSKQRMELPKLGNIIFIRSPKFYIKKSDIDTAIVTAVSRGSETQFVQGFDLNVNGQNIGVGSARPQADYYGNPGITAVYYNDYDITRQLNDGQNVISVLAGGVDCRRAFWARLELFLTSGIKKTLLITDEKWKALDASTAFGDYGFKMRSIYFEMIAENMDMRYYPQSWESISFNDSYWPNAIMNLKPLISKDETLVPYCSENTVRVETNETTKKIVKISNQDYLLDLGKEIIGSLKVKLNSDVEQRIDVFMGEQLNDDGHVRHHLAAGPDYVENWTLSKGTNQFTTFQVKNFRYVEIVGFQGEINPNDIKGWAIEQPFNVDESNFNSDNDLLNREYELSKYSIKATNQDIFVDSQARERRAYEGDLLVNGLASYAVSSSYSLARHSLDYLIDNPTWPEDYKLFNVEMAWLDYLYTGNDDELRNRYSALKYKFNRGKNSESFDGASQDFKGSLKNIKGVDNFDESVGLVTNNGLVDWPITERDGFVEGKYNTPFNAIFYGVYLIMGKIAKVTDHFNDAKFYTNRAKIIKAQLINRLYDKKNGKFFDSLNADLSINRHSSHHSSAYALCYGVYDNQEMSDRLAQFVANNGEFIGSIYFVYFMLKGLVDSGHVDKAIELLVNSDNKKNAKTFAAILDQLHATISPETWSNYYKPNLTLSHPWGAVPGLIIVKGILGINPTKAGFNEFIVRIFPGPFNQFSAIVPSAKGLIEIAYVHNTDSTLLKVGIPMNSRAVVELPKISPKIVIKDVNGKYLNDHDVSGNKFGLPSGKYVVFIK